MEIAAVVGNRRAVRQLVTGLVGKLVSPDEVASPDLDGVEVQFARHGLDHAFHGVSGVGAPSPSDRGVAGRVGE